MTGRIHFTPEAEQQLDHLDTWLVEQAGGVVARRFVEAILDHIDGILTFPLAGQARDDIRPGMRTTSIKKRTVIAYQVDDSSSDLVVTVIGIFAGGRDVESALAPQQGPETS